MAAAAVVVAPLCPTCGAPKWQHTRDEGEACALANPCRMAHDWRHVESMLTQTGEIVPVREDLDLIACARCHLLSLTTGGSA